jgi:hypothetical protein
MDSGDVTVHPPVPSLPAGAPAAAAPVPATTDPFGRPPRRHAAAQSLRKRIGSALAAIAALVAKFWAAIKGVLLLLPKAKLLTTSRSSRTRCSSDGRSPSAS